MIVDYSAEYAGMKAGKIVEFPFPPHRVTKELLDKREVMKVETDAKPTVDYFHRAIKKLKVVLGEPRYVYDVVTLSPYDFVKQNYYDVLSPYFHLERLAIDTIPQEVFGKMVKAVLDLGTMELDRFAQTRGYDGIVSLVSYKGDSNSRFDAEGTRGMELRSLYWSTLTEFNEAIIAGQREFPRDIESILAMVPKLTWE